MSFVLYDITFLILFVLITFIFLYQRRKNLQRQGLLYLYRTKIGVKIIDSISKKYSKILKPLQYLVVTCGYALMVGMVWMMIKLAYVYISSPTLAKAIRAPVLTPLFPYVDKLFGNNILPPFYFTYWIIVIAIIAISHEFAHGIFARLNKIKVHATGFGFLGPFLAAFVEPDEKQMEKAKTFPQLAILAAGTFANIVMTILFGIILWLFFVAAFAPTGVYFSSYALTPVNITDISSSLSSVNLSSASLIPFMVMNTTYYTTSSSVQYTLDNNLSQLLVYDNSPAFKSNLSGAITQIDETKITSYNDLNKTLSSHSPGDVINVKTIDNGKENNYEIKLADNNGRAVMGIMFSGNAKPSGLLGWFYSLISDFKNPMVYYQSLMGDFGVFIYDMLWWIVIINVSVALMNMLPLGIFDGGKFFYLSILALTRSKKVSEIAYKFSTWFFLILLAAMMLKWILIFV